MTKGTNLSIEISRKGRGLSTVFGSVLFLILILTISSALFVSLYNYNDSVQQATNIETNRVQEQIILSNLTLSNGYVTGVKISNIGSITSQIKAFYVNSIFVCDPSDLMLNPNGAYIDSQDSQTINVQPVEYNPTAYITVATARGVKTIELESNLIGGSNSSFGAMETNYGPLRLSFERFYYRNTDAAGWPIGPWQPGSNVSMTTSYCAWNITVTNIDIRNITLNQYSCLTLVPNAPGLQAPSYINSTSLFIASNQTLNIIFLWKYPLPCTDAADAGKLNKNTAKVFLTFYGQFSDGSTYGQTIPFEAVIFVKSYPSISPPTLTPLSPVPYGMPVTASVMVSASFVTPTGYVDFQVSTDGGITFTKFGATKRLSSGMATSDPYIAPSTGNYQIRAVYLGDNNYFDITSSSTPLTVIQAAPIMTISLSSQLIPTEQSVTATITIAPTGATGTVQFEISTDNGTTFTQLGNNKTLSSDSATSDPYTPQDPGNNYRFRAIYEGDGNFLNSTSIQVTLIASGALHHFDFDLISTPQTAGVPFSITITAKDSYGFTVTNYTGSSALTDSTGTISPTTTGAFSAGIRIISVAITKADTDIMISTFEGEASGTSNSFSINPDVLDHFDFDLISTPQTAGVPFSITITAHDLYNNIVTSYSGINSLTDLSNSINPAATGTFSNGIWIGMVTITNSNSANTISTSGNGKGGNSNTFDVV